MHPSSLWPRLVQDRPSLDKQLSLPAGAVHEDGWAVCPGGGEGGKRAVDLRASGGRDLQAPTGSDHGLESAPLHERTQLGVARSGECGRYVKCAAARDGRTTHGAGPGRAPERRASLDLDLPLTTTTLLLPEAPASHSHRLPDTQVRPLLAAPSCAWEGRPS